MKVILFTAAVPVHCNQVSVSYTHLFHRLPLWEMPVDHTHVVGRGVRPHPNITAKFPRHLSAVGTGQPLPEEICFSQRAQKKHIIVKINEMLSQIRDSVDIQLDGMRAEGRQVFCRDKFIMTNNMELRCIHKMCIRDRARPKFND